MSEIKKLLENLTKSASDTPQMEDAFRITVDEFGGVKSFARKIRQVYEDDKTTPMVKAKLIEMIFWMMKEVNIRQKSANLSEIPTEDIEAALYDALKNSHGQQIQQILEEAKV